MACGRSKLPLADRPVFSPTMVAELFEFSQATIVRCCDTGDLKCHRLPSRGRDRRILRRHLIEWARRHGLPLAWAKEVKPEEGCS